MGEPKCCGIQSVEKKNARSAYAKMEIKCVDATSKCTFYMRIKEGLEFEKYKVFDFSTKGITTQCNQIPGQ